MKQMGKKITKPLIAISLLLLFMVSVTIAYYNSVKEFQNPFHTKKPGVAIHEKFNPADWWVPGEEKSKQVWFSNTDEMDMLLRFRIDVEWTTKPKDKDGKELTDKELADAVTLYWKDSTNGGPIALPTAGELDGFDFVPHEETVTVNGESKTYIYYYYKKVLKAEGADLDSTQHVLESVKFSPNLSNDGHEHSDYSNVQFDVTIVGETVLADAKDALEQWGKEVVIDEEKEPQVSWKFN